MQGWRTQRIRYARRHRHTAHAHLQSSFVATRCVIATNLMTCNFIEVSAVVASHLDRNLALIIEAVIAAAASWSSFYGPCRLSSERQHRLITELYERSWLDVLLEAVGRDVTRKLMSNTTLIDWLFVLVLVEKLQYKIQTNRMHGVTSSSHLCKSSCMQGITKSTRTQCANACIMQVTVHPKQAKCILHHQQTAFTHMHCTHIQCALSLTLNYCQIKESDCLLCAMIIRSSSSD